MDADLPDVEDNNQDSDTEDTGAKFTLIFTCFKQFCPLDSEMMSE